MNGNQEYVRIKKKFIKNCVESEGKPILLTIDEPILLEGKKEEEKSFNTGTTVYFGILIEFPYVETTVTDSHVIRILPLLSGYKYISKKDEKSKEEMKIKWTQYYEIHADSKGIVIPRKKIINFSIYDEKTHKNLVFGEV